MKKLLSVILAVLLLASCDSGLVARVGDIKISTNEFAFYLNSIKSQMQGTELTTDTDWENQEIEGKKAIEVAKERALDIAVRNAMYIEASKAYGIELTLDDKMTIDGMKGQLITNYGGKDGYNAYLTQNHITDKFIDMMLESAAYQNKVYEKIKSETPVTEDELFKYYEANKSDVEARHMKAKHILILTTDAETRLPIEKTEKDKARRRYESLLKRARSGEDFDALMNEFSEDPGLANSPDGYVFTSGEMVPEFESAVDSADFDEIVSCESDYGYHIIKRLPVTYEDVKNSLLKDIESSRIDKLVEEWTEEYNIEIIKNEENYKDIK